MSDSRYAYLIKKTVDDNLAHVTTPEFWEELGPELTEKFKKAVHFIANETSAAVLDLFRADVVKILKDASKSKPMFESAEAYFKVVNEEPPEKN